MTTSAIKAEEYFFATTLEKAGASSTWEPLQWEPAQRLAIRQLMLGHTAKADEYNVIEVESPSVNGPIKIPIAVLRIGEQRVVQANLEFPEGPITFKLIEGNGPVFISGLQAPPDVTASDEAYAMDEMAGEEDLGDEEELLDEEDYVEEEQELENPPKRQKLSNNSNSK